MTFVSCEEVERWERSLQKRAASGALKRAREGETEWDSLCEGMGRNELADLLPFVWTRLYRWLCRRVVLPVLPDASSYHIEPAISGDQQPRPRSSAT